MEKSMAQPDYYPMTLKALTAACNQKQNRDPVMDLDEDTVWDSLESLRKRNLVTMVLPGSGARSKRFKHEVETCFGWHKRERAIMAELLLRGPQTLGELRTRCNRFIPFESLEAVTIVLDNLAQYETPFAKKLPRQPGQSAERYTHLLYPEGEEELPESEPDVYTPSVENPCVAPANNSDTAEVDILKEEIEALRNEVADLQRRLRVIEEQLL